MTKEQAEQKARELNNERVITVFCPLIKDMCRADCECFHRAVVFEHKRGGGDFDCTNPSCDCSCLH